MKHAKNLIYLSINTRIHTNTHTHIHTYIHTYTNSDDMGENIHKSNVDYEGKEPLPPPAEKPAAEVCTCTGMHMYAY
jgi:hypothetical protein